MAAFTYPGVYIQELSSGIHTITGVATSIAAFVGWAPQGPVNEATLVESWPEYVAQFGGLYAKSYLGYAVNQFFANGGNQCYIVRLVWDGTLLPASGNPAACATAVATGVGYGIANIVATSPVAGTSNKVAGSIALGIGAPVLQSIGSFAIVPGNAAPGTPNIPIAGAIPPIPIGASLALAAIGSNSDGSSSTPASLSWTTSNSSIFTINSSSGVAKASGVDTADNINTAIIGAVSSPLTGSLTLTATPASVLSISILPAAPVVANGQSAQLTAIANYSDGTSVDVTAIATWTASNSAVTFGAAPVVPGQIIGASTTATTTTVTATLPWTFPVGTTPAPQLSASTTVTANPKAVVSMTVSPANATIPLHVTGTQTQLAGMTVLATYSDKTTTPAPSPLAWTSSNPAVATIDPNAGTFLTIGGIGTTTITATFTDTTVTPSYSVTASTTLNVTAAHLTGITVMPQTLTIPSGLNQQMKATGVFDDGSSVDLSAAVTWSTSGPNSTDATINANGLVTAAKNISTPTAVTLEATWLGTATATASLTITPAIIQSIQIVSYVPTAPPSPLPAPTTSITVGGTSQFYAAAKMSDGTITDVTSSAAWSTTTPTLASVSNSGTKGVVTALAQGGSLTLFAANPGAWGNTLNVSISTQPPPNNNRFSILVQQPNSTGQLQSLESFGNLSVSSIDPNYVVNVIDQDSNYLTFINPATTNAVIPTAAPSATTVAVVLSGGADGAVLAPATDQNFELAILKPNAGVNLLDRVDIFNLLCVPGETDAPTISKLQAYCFNKRAFYLVDPPSLSTIANLSSTGPVGSTAGSITSANAGNSAFYFPWISAPDPLFGNRARLFPPSGFVAGIYAATDATRGVWKAPAGVDAGLTGNSGLQYVLTDAENGSLNPQAVNCLRQFKVYGDVVWGARTLAGNDQVGSEWKYVNIRRLALYLESSLFDGTQWVVFEPNDEKLWGQIRLNVGSFMQGLFLQGAFAGSTPQLAYFVKCDGENNPPTSVALGIVNILVGFAPLYPAEFVVIQIQQIAATASQ